MKARLGQLGEIDYTFTPASGGGSCGEPRKGTFEGTFSFTGENDYVSFEADRASRTFLVAGAKACAGKARAAVAEAKPEEEAALPVHTPLPFPVRSLLVLEGKEARPSNGVPTGGRSGAARCVRRCSAGGRSGSPGPNSGRS